MIDVKTLVEQIIGLGLTPTQVEKLSGVARATIKNILDGSDCKVSTYNQLQELYEKQTAGTQVFRDVNGKNNIFNTGNRPVFGLTCAEVENVELATLRAKDELQQKMIAMLEGVIADKNRVIEQLTSRINELTKADV